MIYILQDRDTGYIYDVFDTKSEAARARDKIETEVDKAKERVGMEVGTNIWILPFPLHSVYGKEKVNW